MENQLVRSDFHGEITFAMDEIAQLRQELKQRDNMIAELQMQLAMIHYERCLDSAKLA